MQFAILPIVACYYNRSTLVHIQEKRAGTSGRNTANLTEKWPWRNQVQICLTKAVFCLPFWIEDHRFHHISLMSLSKLCIEQGRKHTNTSSYTSCQLLVFIVFYFEGRLVAMCNRTVHTMPPKYKKERFHTVETDGLCGLEHVKKTKINKSKLQQSYSIFVICTMQTQHNAFSATFTHTQQNSYIHRAVKTDVEDK